MLAGTPIGIIVAMSKELRTLTHQKAAIGDCLKLNDQYMAILSGIGAEAASEAARRIVAKDIRHLISWGLAAALVPELKPGSLVLADTVLDTGGNQFVCDAPFNQSLADKLENDQPIFSGSLYGSATLLKTPNHKRALSQSTGAVAADMESAAIASVARKVNGSFNAIRAISDDAQTSIPELSSNILRANGQLQFGLLLADLIRRPTIIWPLIQLALGVRQAYAGLRKTGSVLIN